MIAAWMMAARARRAERRPKRMLIRRSDGMGLGIVLSWEFNSQGSGSEASVAKEEGISISLREVG
jgi:hypothetical protein